MNTTGAAVSLSVVVPIYRCGSSIPELLRRLHESLDATAFSSWELILVDDASPDDSASFIETAAVSDRRVRALYLKENIGQSRAILEGVKIAAGRWTAVMDGDLQDAPEDLPRLLAEMQRGFDAVFGTRRGNYDSRARMLTSKILKKLLSFISGAPADAGCFVVMSHSMRLALAKVCDGKPHFVTAIGLTGLPFSSVPVERKQRSVGMSAYTSPMRLSTGWDALRFALKRGLIERHSRAGHDTTDSGARRRGIALLTAAVVIQSILIGYLYFVQQKRFSGADFFRFHYSETVVRLEEAGIIGREARIARIEGVTAMTGLPVNERPVQTDFFYLLMTPFALLTPKMAVIAYLLVNYSAFLAGTWILLRAFRFSHRHLICAFFAVSAPIYHTLMNGQPTGMLFLCFALAIASSNRRPLLSGFWLAIALALKTYLAPILALAAVAGRWRTALTAFCLLILFQLVDLQTVISSASLSRRADRWIDMGFHNNEYPMYRIDASTMGVSYRLFHGEPEIPFLYDLGNNYRAVYAIIAGLFFLVSLYSIRRCRNAPGSTARQYGIMISSACLTAPALGDYMLVLPLISVLLGFSRAAEMMPQGHINIRRAVLLFCAIVFILRLHVFRYPDMYPCGLPPVPPVEWIALLLLWLEAVIP